MNKIFFAILIFFNPVFADKYNWPCSSHDFEGTHYQDSEKTLNSGNVQDLYVKWFKGGSAVIASPAIVSGKVYYGDAKGNMHAAQIEDGAEVWNAKIGTTSLISSPTIIDDCIYTGCHRITPETKQEISHLVEISRRSGSLGWQSYAEGGDTIPLFEHAPAYDSHLVIGATSSKEALEEKKAYGFQGGVYAFDKKTGLLKWRYKFTDINAGEGGGVDASSSPALDTSNGLLFIATGNAYEEPASDRSCALLCLDYKTNKRDGELIWKYQFTDSGLWSKQHPEGKFWGIKGSPLLFKSAGKRLVGISDNDHVYHAFDRKSGKLVWTVSLIPKNEVPLPLGSSSAASDDEMIYASANYAAGEGFTSDLFTKPFTEEKQKSMLKLLSQECKSTVTAIKAKSGTISWQKSFEGANLACVSLANGVIYATFFNGYFRALEAKTGKVLFEFLTGPAPGAYGVHPYNLNMPLNTTPVISNGMVLVGAGYFFPQTLNKAVPGGIFAFTLQ